MPPNTILVSLPKPSFPNLRAARHAKDERLNTWLFNRRLSVEWSTISILAIWQVWIPCFKIPGRLFSSQRLPKATRVFTYEHDCVAIRSYHIRCPTCTIHLRAWYKMPDPNRDQRSLREETTDLWLRKRRAQQLILRRDHHLFEFYFILFESGRWRRK